MNQVQEVVSGLSREEIIWLSGYLSGMTLAQESPSPTAALPVANPLQKITIAYGTETGNAKKLATTLAAKAKKAGIQTKLVSLDQYRLADLTKETLFFTIISTQGEGEPPATAKKFFDYVHENSVSLAAMHFSVLALGDMAYPLFCKAGEDVDRQLERLGGKRLLPLHKLDTEYAEAAEQWTNSLLQALLQFNTVAAAPVVVGNPEVKTQGKQIYRGTVQANLNLNGRGSNKQTFHLEIGCDAVAYEPGDALGLVPKNDPAVVQKILTLSGLSEETPVPFSGETKPLGQLLSNTLSLLNLSSRVVKKYAAVVKQEIPETRMDFSDLLRIYPTGSSEQFYAALQILDPITPRLYSLASSPEAHGSELHLTIARHQFETGEQVKTGLASGYLSQLKAGEEISFYIHKNHHFRLPAAGKDIIMVGPGTGVAPFRSFIAHRDATGATGRNWLFFGDQHFTTDFLYQTDWLNWLDTGVLTQMNVAFSRDQPEKLYVQHKLWQHREQLVNWLEEGAVLYVCGAKEPMSIDVENSLVQIVKDQKKLSGEAAIAYLQHLKEEGRFLKDVY